MNDYASTKQAVLDKLRTWLAEAPNEEVFSVGENALTRKEIFLEIDGDTLLGRQIVQNWTSLDRRLNPPS